MAKIPGLKRYVRGRVDGDARAAELEAELQFHLETKLESLRAQGLSPEAARTEAIRQLGDLERVRVACERIDRGFASEERRADVLQSLGQDLRYAGRGLRRSPLFTSIAVSTLALGIGATTSIFSVVNATLLRPLPYVDADQIVLVGEAKVGEKGGVPATTAYDNVMEWRRRSRSFEALAVIDDWAPALTGTGDPERLTAARVTADVFDVLRVVPALGRPIQPADNAPDAPNVIVVSDAFWRVRLGGANDVIGRSVTLNAVPHTIIGVLPPGFRAPAELDAVLWANNGPDPRDGHTSRYQRAIGRLGLHVSLEQARAEMREISRALEREFPRDFADEVAVLTPLRDALVGDTRRPILLVLGAAALVLLIACANLSNLLLARGMARVREFAVRVAMGASRGRAVRQLLTESALLASLGALIGMLLARWLTTALASLAPESMRAEVARGDWRVLAFATAMTVMTTLVFGLVPALRSTRVDVQGALKDGARGSGGASVRTRDALVIGQLALALTLLVSAGVLLRSYERLSRVDPGIRPNGLLVAAINLPGARYPNRAPAELFDRLRQELAAIPGVEGAAVASIIPFSTNWDMIGFDIDGEPHRTGAEELGADRYIVTPGYFATMGVPVREGRVFTEADGNDRPLVAVVDEVLARRIGGQVIGKRAKLPGRLELATIVGVVGHVKHYGLDRESGGQIYMSHVQYPWRWMHVVVRTSRPPLTLAADLRRTVHAIDPQLPIFDVTTIDALMSDRMAHRRMTLRLLGAFAGLATLLAAMGLYGVIAYAVSQRKIELGIRAALGARPADMMRMVVAHGARLAVLGLVIGSVASFWTTRLVSALLFGVGPYDPVVLVSVAALFFTIAGMGSALPALRAARVSPLVSLRAD